MDYKTGDIVTYTPFGGGNRHVRVTVRDTHNGQGAFTGTVLDDASMEVWGYDNQITAVRPQRHAVVRGAHERLETVRRYLPSNYTADSDGADVLIHGHDSHGWTLEDYVIARLASGMIRAEEVTA